MNCQNIKKNAPQIRDFKNKEWPGITQDTGTFKIFTNVRPCTKQLMHIITNIILFSALYLKSLTSG